MKPHEPAPEHRRPIARKRVAVESLCFHEPAAGAEPGEHAITIAFRKNGAVCVFPISDDAAGLARAFSSFWAVVVENPSLLPRLTGAES